MYVYTFIYVLSLIIESYELLMFDNDQIRG